MTPAAWISKLKFSDATEVSLGQEDVVILVGPNNAGKSAALRGIMSRLVSPEQPSPVVRAVELARSGTQADLISWLESWATRQPAAPSGNPLYLALGTEIHGKRAATIWAQSDHALGELTRWFCHLLTTEERLYLSNAPTNIALGHANPAHPIHFLQRDDRLELRLSEQFKRAFGLDLVVHRGAGGIVPLHVGLRPVPEKNEDRISLSYVKRLERLPDLQSQGDGMRSFAGVLLALSVGKESMILVDEPEAFLHPPQARLIGATLIVDRQRKRQVFVATHSTDVLRGMLDADKGHVRVIRLRRSADRNLVSELPNARIQQLWNDPLLRHSNILDGLFHDGVVVAESDSDCRFYSALLNTIRENETSRSADIMFTHCGGKTRLPVALLALRAIEVPTVALADFDILHHEQDLQRCVDALGGDWSAIRVDWAVVHAAISAKKPELETAKARSAIDEVFGRVSEKFIPSAAEQEIRAILRQSSAWAYAKTIGKAFVPPGHPRQACDRLLTSLRTLGLFVVPVGELESFARSEGNHGPKWVNAVLQKDLANDPELHDAREFVGSLVAYLSSDPPLTL